MKKKLLVQQSNALIESSQKLTLVERRLLYYILSRINPKEPKNTFQLKVEDFADDFPQMGKGTIYNQLKDGVQKLFKRDVQLITERGSTKIFYMLQAQEYKDKEGFLSVKFSEDMMPLIFELKQKYTSMLLENFKNLDSVYSLRLYELLCQYQNTGKREITVEDLRFLLDCVETNKEFKFFKLRVIEPSIKEINEKSNLFIHNIIYNRVGRKINSVTFEFSDKQFIQEAEHIEDDNKAIKNTKQKETKITQEPTLKRYIRISHRDTTNTIKRDKLNDKEALHHAMEFAKCQHLSVIRTAFENLKTISNYERETGYKLSSRLYQAKNKAQAKLGEYYSNISSYPFLTIEELDTIKNEIFERIEKG